LERSRLAALLGRAVDNLADLALAAVRRRRTLTKANAQRRGRVGVRAEGSGAAGKGADKIGPALGSRARLTTDRTDALAAGKREKQGA
jgi:hypothetical protein